MRLIGPLAADANTTQLDMTRFCAAESIETYPFTIKEKANRC